MSQMLFEANVYTFRKLCTNLLLRFQSNEQLIWINNLLSSWLPPFIILPVYATFYFDACTLPSPICKGYIRNIANITANLVLVQYQAVPNKEAENFSDFFSIKK